MDALLKHIQGYILFLLLLTVLALLVGTPDKEIETCERQINNILILGSRITCSLEMRDVHSYKVYETGRKRFFVFDWVPDLLESNKLKEFDMIFLHNWLGKKVKGKFYKAD